MEREHDALATLEFLDAVRTATRSRIALFWFPMAIFGCVSLGAAVVSIAWGLEAVGLYWVVVGIPAGILTAWHYQRSESAAGLTTSAVPHLLVVGVLAFGAFALPVVVPNDPAWAIALWVGAGYLAFSALERSQTIAVVALSFVGLGALFWQLEIPGETAWFSSLSGTVLLIGASVSRPRSVL